MAAGRCRDFQYLADVFQGQSGGLGEPDEGQAFPDVALARWAAQLAPVVAIEAVIAWLDAGQPEPAQAAARVRRAVMGVIGAAASGADCSFPRPASKEGPAS
jgi:hypothetical protein